MPTSNKLTPDDIDLARRLYLAGTSLATIAKVLSVSKSAIYYHLRRLVPMRPRGQAGRSNRFFRGGGRHDKTASRVVQTAIAAGEIVKPDACENCGREPIRGDTGAIDIVAHHDDYNKPRSVRWLCRRCHYEWHRHNKAIALVEPASKRKRRRRKRRR